MNTMQFREFIESVWSGRLNYKLPSDKEQQLYDFYMFTLLNRTGDKEADYVVKEISNELLRPLKQNLLDALLFAICAEIRHVFDRMNTEDDLWSLSRMISYNLGTEYSNIFTKYVENYTNKDMPYGSRENPFLGPESWHNQSFEKNNDASYVKSYQAMTAAASSPDKIVELCAFLYSSQHLWATSYGGSPWARICAGWQRLKNAKSEADLIVAIDHVYDLQHNTNTVFNKLDEYYKNGYVWIKKALDFKRDIKKPFALYEKISPQLRPLAARILKMKYGHTKEDFKDPESFKSPQGIKNAFSKIALTGQEHQEINNIANISGRSPGELIRLADELLLSDMKRLDVYKIRDSIEIPNVVKLIREKVFGTFGNNLWSELVYYRHFGMLGLWAVGHYFEIKDGLFGTSVLYGLPVKKFNVTFILTLSFHEGKYISDSLRNDPSPANISRISDWLPTRLPRLSPQFCEPKIAEYANQISGLRQQQQQDVAKPNRQRV